MTRPGVRGYLHVTRGFALILSFSLPLVVLAAFLCSPASGAEQVVEVWRSTPPPFNTPLSVSVNPTDGSCWVADYGNNEVAHVAESGAELWRGGGFNGPVSVSANPTDGSCWVADYYNNEVVHLAADGTELSRGGGFYGPMSVSVNPADGSCWVADYYNGEVVHLAADGTELWWGGAVYGPISVSVDPTDGSCWVADFDNSEVVHLAADGTELWRGGGFYTPYSVSVNPTDGSCWVADQGNDQVVHLAADGTELWRGGGFYMPYSVSANSTDGSCWVADSGNDEVVHLAADGTQLWRGGGFGLPRCVSANPSDGSCWVADYFNNDVVHLAQDGTELWRSAGFDHPYCVSANPTDASCWVADYFNGDVVHLGESGTELWRGGAFAAPWTVSVNSADGSCWVGDVAADQVVHLAEAGTELWRGGGCDGPTSVSVNPSDGSCWVADYYNDEIVHLSAAGTELWRGGGFYAPYSVSVNPSNGSCWVADTYNDQVVHLAADGTELWRGGGFYAPYSVSVNVTDASCWVADYYNNEVVHLAEDGTELWRGWGFYGPMSVSVNSSDGSCWVADYGNSQVVHLAEDGTELWRGGAFDHPLSVSVNSADGSCWVADYGNNQVVHLAIAGYDGAAVVSATIPTTMLRTQSKTVTVTMLNTGTITWTQAGGYALSAVNPDDNTTWGLNRVELDPADSIAPGQEKTFTFIITAPDTASSGVACDWRMILEGAYRFGETSSNSVGVHTFSDVPPALSYWCHVEAAYRQGIMTGTSYDPQTRERLFSADQLVSRKEIARLLCWVAGREKLDSETPHFSDVFKDNPYYAWIERLADSDSWYDPGNPCLTPPTQGCGANPPYDPPTYCPDTVVTRAQMAVFICRAKGKCPWDNPTPTFEDVPPSAPYYGYVERLADPGSWNTPPTQGCSWEPRLYCPDDPSTRAIMAVFLTRAWDHSCDEWVPDVTIDQPAEGANLTGTVQFQVAAAAAKVEFWVNNESEPRYTDDTAPFTWDCDTRMIPGGATTITVRAYDGSGKAGLKNVNVTIDNVIFNDVPHTVAYWRHVEAVWRAGIVDECAPDQFCPNDDVYRKNMAEFLCKAAGRTWLASPTPRFGDVPGTHPYYGWIERLADSGSWDDPGNPCLTPPTQGCGGGNFCPDDNVTRAQMAVFLCRAKGKCELDNPTPTFGDVPPSASYYGFVERLADPGSWECEPPTQGCGGGNFCPDDLVNRAMMAVFLARAYCLPL